MEGFHLSDMEGGNCIASRNWYDCADRAAVSGKWSLGSGGLAQHDCPDRRAQHNAALRWPRSNLAAEELRLVTIRNPFDLAGRTRIIVCVRPVLRYGGSMLVYRWTQRSWDVGEP
jgi:hypothetical protein